MSQATRVKQWLTLVLIRRHQLLTLKMTLLQYVKITTTNTTTWTVTHTYGTVKTSCYWLLPIKAVAGGRRQLLQMHQIDDTVTYKAFGKFMLWIVNRVSLCLHLTIHNRFLTKMIAIDKTLPLLRLFLHHHQIGWRHSCRLRSYR